MAWLLSLLSVIVVVQGQRRNQAMIPFVAAVLMGILAYFLGIIAFASNPLEKMPLALSEGMGLNPLLRTSDMFSHPTTLLLGFVIFTVPFAFAMAALISGRLDDWWLRSARHWTIVAWIFLSLGNLFGMLWAYTVLGWGGYWGWDPVENAAFMPWLTATAFLHSLMIQERRGMLKLWNMLLIIVTYALCLFGVLLTRSGMLSSVHAFATGAVGPLLLVLTGLVLVGSLTLLWTRLPHLRSEHQLDSLVSREASFLANNLVLLGTAFAVFWGTVFPILSEAVRGVKVGVGAPFYEQTTAPMFLALIVLMGICPLIGWRKASSENLARNFIFPLAAAMPVALILYVLGMRTPYALISFSALAFVAGAILLEFWRGARARHRGHGDSFASALPRLVWHNRRRYGGHIVHTGVILFAMGIAASHMFSTSAERTLAPGESIEVRDYTVTFRDLKESAGSGSLTVTARLDVSRGGNDAGTIEASKRFEGQEEQPVTDVGLRSTFQEDLYVVLNDWTDDGKVILKVAVNPLVMWIWIGGGVIVLGTLIALWPDTRPGHRVPAMARVPASGLEVGRA
jgi:cytochrome c-type biogenesis protein CcmF